MEFSGTISRYSRAIDISGNICISGYSYELSVGRKLRFFVVEQYGSTQYVC